MSTLADQEDSLPYQGHQHITHPLSIVSLCPGYMWHEHRVTNSRVTFMPSSDESPTTNTSSHVGGKVMESLPHFSSEFHKVKALYLPPAVMCDGSLVALHRKWMTYNLPTRPLWLWCKVANRGLSEEEKVGGLWPSLCSPGRDQSEFHRADRWRNLISSRHSDIMMWYHF